MFKGAQKSECLPVVLAEPVPSPCLTSSASLGSARACYFFPDGPVSPQHGLDSTASACEPVKSSTPFLSPLPRLAFLC